MLTDVDIGWVDSKVVQTHIRFNANMATLSRSTSKNVQKAGLTSPTGSHCGRGLSNRDFAPDVVQELSILSFIYARLFWKAFSRRKWLATLNI